MQRKQGGALPAFVRCTTLKVGPSWGLAGNRGAYPVRAAAITVPGSGLRGFDAGCSQATRRTVVEPLANVLAAHVTPNCATGAVPAAIHRRVSAGRTVVVRAACHTGVAVGVWVRWVGQSAAYHQNQNKAEKGDHAVDGSAGITVILKRHRFAPFLGKTKTTISVRVSVPHAHLFYLRLPAQSKDDDFLAYPAWLASEIKGRVV